MSYQRLVKPRIFTDTLSLLAATGVAPSSLIALPAGTVNAGHSHLNLINGAAQTRTSFDTSGNPTTDIIVGFDLQDTSHTISAGWILNHNLLQAKAILTYVHHTSAVTGATIGAATAVTHAHQVGSEHSSNHNVENNDSNVLTWEAVAGKRFWGLRIADYSSFSATDLEIGILGLGNYWDAPFGADELSHKIGKEHGVDLKETPGGARRAQIDFATGGEGSVWPFGPPFRMSGTSYAHQAHTGRRRKSLLFPTYPDTCLLQSNYATGIGASVTLEDVISRCRERAIPVIFTVDGTSKTAGDYMWCRIMKAGEATAVGAGLWSVPIELEEEF